MLGGVVVVGVGSNPDGAQLVFLYFSTIYIYICDALKKDTIYDLHCISRYLYKCFSNNISFFFEREGVVGGRRGGVLVAHLVEVDSSVLGVFHWQS